MLRKLVMIAVVSGLAARGLGLLLRRAEDRAYLRHKREQKAEVHRWEDEGGLVPDAVAPTDR